MDQQKAALQKLADKETIIHGTRWRLGDYFAEAFAELESGLAQSAGEPVYQVRDADGFWIDVPKSIFDMGDKDGEQRVVYTGQQPLAVPAKMTPEGSLEIKAGWDFGTDNERFAWVDGWNACRDAMLAAAPEVDNAEGQQA